MAGKKQSIVDSAVAALSHPDVIRREHWIDLGKIIAVLTTFTVLSVAAGQVFFDVWIDVFHPFFYGGAVLALIRLGRRRRQLNREEMQMSTFDN